MRGAASRIDGSADVTLLVVGLNHRTAPLHVREQFAIPSRELPSTLRALRRHFQLDEVVAFSTCNRVEIYAASHDPATTFQDLVDFLASRSHLSPTAFQSVLYRFSGSEAVAHLFRVTAGLDSMVLGESEITAQVKQAYELAHAQGATGPVLNRLFQKALHSAKLIRSKTRIAQGQASIGSVVVALARQLFGDDLQHREVLLWGAGKAAETTARHLIKHGVQRLSIVNRTQLKAQDLALLCQGGWLSWEQAFNQLAHVDIAIVCTQAPHYVIDAADMAAILPQRGSRELCLIDLAVPRNVDPTLKRLTGMRLYNIDDLQSIASDGLLVRRQEVARCETLIERQVEQFSRREHPQYEKEVIPCGFVEASSSV